MPKTVLSIIEAVHSGADLKAAIELCEEAGAHLSVLIVEFAPPTPIGEYGLAATDIWAKERQTDIESLKKKVDAAEEVVAKYGISADIESAYAEQGWLSTEIGRRALYTDMTLIGAQSAGADMMRTAIMDGTLFEARNPALLVPPGMKASLMPQRVMIAWDSRVEAARSVHEALDLLKQATQVHVTLVDPSVADNQNGAEPGADIAAYLARYGVHVVVDQLASGGRPISDVLTRHATDISADMIVMGAYGHSRLRERIFGGVTKSMIEKPPLPLFMAR